MRILTGILLLCTLIGGHLMGQPAMPPARAAEWIAPYTADSLTPSTPCPILRSVFNVGEEPVSATVKVVGLGHFELKLNGTRVGESVIHQAWSQFDKTIYEQTFDVTKL